MIASNKQREWAELQRTLDRRKDAKYWKIVIFEQFLSPTDNQSSNTLVTSGVVMSSNVRLANGLVMYYPTAIKIDYQKENKKIKLSATKLLIETRRHSNDYLFIKNITIDELNLVIKFNKRNKSLGNDKIYC